MNPMNPMNSMSPLPPVELQAPDITPWKQGNTGVDYVHAIEAGRPTRPCWCRP